MEPMRQVVNTDVPVDARVRHKNRWWRAFFLVLFSIQLALMIGFGVSFIWAAAVGCVAYVCFEGAFWFAGRHRLRPDAPSETPRLRR